MLLSPKRRVGLTFTVFVAGKGVVLVWYQIPLKSMAPGDASIYVLASIALAQVAQHNCLWFVDQLYDLVIGLWLFIADII